MTSRTRWLLLGFALIGLGFATTSSWVHYRLLTDPSYVSPCDVSATFNCTQAYLSRYGSVWGVPVALGGVAWFALVAIVAAFARSSAAAGSSSRAASYVFGLSVIGLASILRLAYASYVVLKVVCLLCLGTYACVVGILVVSALASTVPVTRMPQYLLGDLRASLARPLALTIALLYVAGAATAVAFFPREMRQPTSAPAPPPASAQEQFAAAWAQQPRVDLGIPAAGAKVVIVKFNDWLCPTCKLFHYQYQPVLDLYAKSHPGAVRYVLKDFPLSSNCNPLVTQTVHGHESSCEAAAAVRMAGARGKADAMIEWLFTNQDHLVDLNLQGTGGADAIKAEVKTMLGIADFDREYLGVIAAIRQDASDGNALTILTTPTYFVNGIRTTVTERGPTFGQNLPAENLQMAIDLEIARANGVPGPPSRGRQ